MAASAPPLVNLPLVLEKLISKLRSLAGNYGALWQRKTHFWCSKLGFTGAAFCRASRRRRQVSSSSSRCVFDQRGRPRQKAESDIFVCVCLPFYFFILHYFFTTAGRAKTAKQDSNYTHSSEDTNERSMPTNSDKRQRHILSSCAYQHSIIYRSVCAYWQMLMHCLLIT